MAFALALSMQKFMATSRPAKRLGEERAKRTCDEDDRDGQKRNVFLEESWRLEGQHGIRLRQVIPKEDPVYAQVQELLREACPLGHRLYVGCIEAKDLKVLSVEQIHNVKLWKHYTFRKEEIKRENATAGLGAIIESELPPLDWIRLDKDVNEVLLLHGTTSDKIDLIAQEGFDARMARETGLYGQGVYFTDQSCKSASG
eukprot:Skav230487  [mRNA]  locus=scaffold1445:387101:391292:- [translate_table: standard]